MADINSLINPPDEAEPVVPRMPKKTRKRADAEPKQEPKFSPEELTVSQETIIASFDRIKTHFPAARIKKIMQSDEDIGKVAQATPVVVGRALEIFMANLVESAIVEAKTAGFRRIAASHVRAAVENTEQFDFLVDVVLKYLSGKN